MRKVATHAVFDKAHNAATLRPLGPQLLYALGMPRDDKMDLSTPVSIKHVGYPPLVKPLPKMPHMALRRHLPLQEFTLPITVAARAAAVEQL